MGNSGSVDVEEKLAGVNLEGAGKPEDVSQRRVADAPLDPAESLLKGHDVDARAQGPGREGVAELVRVQVDPGLLVEQRLRASGIKGVG